MSVNLRWAQCYMSVNLRWAQCCMSVNLRWAQCYVSKSPLGTVLYVKSPLGTVLYVAQVLVRNKKFLAKPRQNADAILETYWQFIYGDIKYIAN